jgi:hypothetical protein
MPTSFKGRIGRWWRGLPAPPETKRQAQQYLEDGEQLLAAFIAAPRGTGMAKWGVPELGQMERGERKVRRVLNAAETAGLPLPPPKGLLARASMALALTDRRLVVLSITRLTVMGSGGDVKALFSAVAVDEVDSIKVKRLLLGKVVIVTVRGVPIELETGAWGYDNAIVPEFERVKAKH